MTTFIKNKYLADREFQEMKPLLMLLLKAGELESKGYIKLDALSPTGVYFWMGKGKKALCICSSERTVIEQTDNKVLDISIAQFVLEIDLFYRMQKKMPKPNVPLIENTHEQTMNLLKVYPFLKQQFEHKVRSMLKDKELIMMMFYS
jgi:hypothetical protein